MSEEVVQLIEYVYDSQFSTDWLINLAELCDFCLEYGCSNVNEFLQQQFLIGYDIRYEVVKHIQIEKSKSKWLRGRGFMAYSKEQSSMRRLHQNKSNWLRKLDGIDAESTHTYLV